ncbi:glycine zipper 2TM domain-containing protein [Rhodoferax sp. AJA081-3]|uniref:glycine zipper 2TM domain-containing protein n=1 Tax=Rhodoferax sp. AJA081-3 TaxID=2752316 RepID=UPI001AE01582|nr:glycine zipper 2TM domain-containing protein [Rhodoferax sp. AJA081-3]QTN27501.1 glycine zipper 2TM domain-containing protein [Rhodoferax sp. AJA081-3]
MNKHILHLAITLAVATQTSAAWASTPATPASTQLAADNKAALARYDSDKKLCNDETSSNARLQCRRDAKAEYDQALAAAKAKAAATPATAPAPVAATPAAPAATAAQATAPACAECGRVLSITVTEKAGEYSAVGVLAGGALGAVLGNQVGGGLGKDLATLAGAAGGAYAGKMIEEKIKTHKVWTVTVIYANESKASFDFTNDPGFQVGDKVRNTGSTVARM